jgi:hypothetical protein
MEVIAASFKLFQVWFLLAFRHSSCAELSYFENCHFDKDFSQMLSVF